MPRHWALRSSNSPTAARLYNTHCICNGSGHWSQIVCAGSLSFLRAAQEALVPVWRPHLCAASAAMVAVLVRSMILHVAE